MPHEVVCVARTKRAGGEIARAHLHFGDGPAAEGALGVFNVYERRRGGTRHPPPSSAGVRQTHEMTRKGPFEVTPRAARSLQPGQVIGYIHIYIHTYGLWYVCTVWAHSRSPGRPDDADTADAALGSQIEAAAGVLFPRTPRLADVGASLQLECALT